MRTGGRSVELLMSRSQRESFDRMQAAMSVIEGSLHHRSEEHTSELQSH